MTSIASWTLVLNILGLRIPAGDIVDFPEEMVCKQYPVAGYQLQLDADIAKLLGVKPDKQLADGNFKVFRVVKADMKKLEKWIARFIGPFIQKPKEEDLGPEDLEWIVAPNIFLALAILWNYVWDKNYREAVNDYSATFNN